MAKKEKIAAVIEFGLNSPQAEKARYKRRKARLALQGIDLDAMMKAKKEQRKALLEKVKPPTKKGAKKNAAGPNTATNKKRDDASVRSGKSRGAKRPASPASDKQHRSVSSSDMGTNGQTKTGGAKGD